MNTAPRHMIQSRMVLLQRNPATGEIVARRRANNTVMRDGAELVAALFEGSVTTPINALAVGLNSDPSEPPYEAVSLTTVAGDGNTLLNLPAVTLAADAITTAVDEVNFKVVLSVQGIIPADRAVSPDAEVESVDIAEAALGVLAPDGENLERIYNRVVFEPIPKRRSHELALFWEIDFPYGT